MKYLKPELEIVSFDEDKLVVLTLESVDPNEDNTDIGEGDGEEINGYYL